MEKLWGFMVSKLKWKGDRSDAVFNLCTSLTNAHIQMHPLRAEDRVHYKTIKNRIYAIGEELYRKRKCNEQNYVGKRRRLTYMRFRAE